MITGIHGNKKASLGIVDNIAVHIGDVVISTDMEVIDTQAYSLVLGTDWLRKAGAQIDYATSQVTINDGSRRAQVECRNSTAPAKAKDDSEDDSDDDDDYEYEDEEDEDINLVLVMNEEESPDQHYYKFDPWGIEIDHETFTWQEYEFMNNKFNPWITNQKSRHKRKH